MKKSFGVFWKKDSQTLNEYKFDDKVSVFVTLVMFLSHKVHKLSDELGHNEVQWCGDKGDNDAEYDFS